MKVVINKVSFSNDIQKCLDIRREVFVVGQNVPINEELDGKDELSDHYLLLVDDNPVGAARVRFVADFAKVERVALLEKYQGKGYGHQMMKAILSDLKKQGSIRVAKLSSQTYAIPFYEKLGFCVCSEEYLDAGIPHKDMKLNLNEDWK